MATRDRGHCLWSLLLTLPPPLILRHMMWFKNKCHLGDDTKVFKSNTLALWLSLIKHFYHTLQVSQMGSQFQHLRTLKTPRTNTLILAKLHMSLDIWKPFQFMLTDNSKRICALHVYVFCIIFINDTNTATIFTWKRCEHGTCYYKPRKWSMAFRRPSS